MKKPTTSFPLNALETVVPAESEDPIKKSIDELKELLTSKFDCREPVKNTALEPNTYEVDVEAVGPARQYQSRQQYSPQQYPPRQHQPESSDKFNCKQRRPPPPPQPRYLSQPAAYDQTYADQQYCCMNRSSAFVGHTRLWCSYELIVRPS